MPFQIAPPVEKIFLLAETDKRYGCEGEPTSILVAKAAQGELSKRNDLFAEFKRTYEADGSIVVSQRLSFDDIKLEEVYLTLRDCNIMQMGSEKPLFQFEKGRMTKPAFVTAWNKLPAGVPDEIHKYVLEMNPQWSEVGETSDAGEEDSKP
jgi:hypothetical protein